MPGPGHDTAPMASLARWTSRRQASPCSTCRASSLYRILRSTGRSPMRVSPTLRLAGAIVIGGCVAMATPPIAAAEEKPKAPVLVASLGQSLDGFQVQLAVRRAGIAYKYDPRAEVDQLGEAKTLFLAVGASLKGFGEAGITIADELARAEHLLDAAKTRGTFIV